MGRITSFLIGAIVGAVGIYGALNYHLVRANDGLHVVPKMSSTLGETYVDVRGFGVEDWRKHPSLAVALMQSGKGSLLQDNVDFNMQQSLNTVVGMLRGESPAR